MTRITLHIALLSVFGLLCKVATAQQVVYEVQHYTTADGLSDRNVLWVREDQRGLLWLGTANGLNQFDGSTFKVYTAETDGLQGNVATYGILDRRGWLWLFYAHDKRDTHIGRYWISGVDVFDIRTGRLVAPEQLPDINLLTAPHQVQSLSPGNQGEIAWIDQAGRLHRYEPDGQLYTIDLQDRYHSDLYLDTEANGTFRIEAYYRATADSTRHYIWLDGDGRELAAIPQIDNNRHTIHFEAAKTGHLLNFDRNDQVQAWTVLPDHRVIPDSNLYGRRYAGVDLGSFYADPRLTKTDQLLWYSSSHRFVATDLRTGRQTSLSEAHPGLLMQHHITVSGTNRIWVGTELGLYQIDWSDQRFRTLLQSVAGRPLAIRGITGAEDGSVWMYTEGSRLWFYHPDKNGEPQYADVDEYHTAPNLYGAHTLSDGSIVYQHYDLQQLLSYQPLTGQITTIARCLYNNRQEPNHCRLSQWSYHETADGQLWIGMEEGQVAYVDEGGIIRPVPRPEWMSEHGAVYQWLPRTDHTVWVATSHGLYVLDTQTRQWVQHYAPDAVDSVYFVPAVNIQHLRADTTDGSMWLATADRGLIQWWPGTHRYQHYTQTDGLSSNNIYAVYPDRQGYLWLPSRNGLMRMHPPTGQVETYFEQDGLSHNEFNRVSHYRAADGTLYFGTINGVTIFHPDDFGAMQPSRDYPLVLTDARLYDDRSDQLLNITAQTTNTGRITLSGSDAYVLLDFALLTYRQANLNRYSYRWEGEGDAWVYQRLGNLRVSGLAYGTHTLRIRGQSAEGTWSSDEIRLQITMVRPLWLRWWFIALLTLLLVGLAYGYYLRRIRKLQRQQVYMQRVIDERTGRIRTQNEVLEQQAVELRSLEEMKSRFFANISHELRTPLTLIIGSVRSMLSRPLPRDAQDNRMLTFADRNSRALLRLVNEILDLMRLQKAEIDVSTRPVDLQAHLWVLLSQYQSISDSRSVGFGYRYQLEPGVLLQLDTSLFDKIIGNFLSNAVKFTPPGGHITVTVRREGSDIAIAVADDGPGIHPQDLPLVFDRFYQARQHRDGHQPGTGIGLSMARELAELQGGRVRAESTLGAGSTFTYVFPPQVVKRAKSLSQNEASGTPSATSTDDIKPNHPPNQSVGQPIPSTTAAPDGQSSSTSKSTPTLLVVEDNADLREYLHLVLADYTVLSVTHGQEALQLLADRTAAGQPPPDLMVSDLMMPVMDGLTLLTHLRQDDAYADMPVIMLTARANMQDRLTALRTGADDYLLKPFEAAELTARIDVLLRRARRRQAVQQPPEAIPAVATEAILPPAAPNAWVQEVEALFVRHATNNAVSVDYLVEQTGLSRRQFDRRLKKEIGLSGSAYLLEIRLLHARRLLEERPNLHVQEVVKAVGLRDVRSFRTGFRKRFGTLPSEWGRE